MAMGFDEILERLVRGTWVSPDTGTHVEIPINRAYVRPFLIKDAARLINSLSIGSTVAIVSDRNGHREIARQLENSLRGVISFTSLVLPTDVEPTMEYVEELRKKTFHSDAVIAVGSGTLNDIVKYTTYLEKKPYLLFGTAPSMNGYVSSTASLIESGKKRSFSAHLPYAVYMDSAIMAQAPLRLVQSGFGDLICRSTSQKDWYLSHALLGTEYLEGPYSLLTPHEEKLHEQAEAIAKCDTHAVEDLTYNLLLSGIGMYISQSSAPASQGEHILTHYMELQMAKDRHQPGKPLKYYHDPNNERVQGPLHGEAIAVTTLAMCRLQERILNKEKLRLKKEFITDEMILKHFGAGHGQQILKEVSKKMMTEERLASVNAILEEKWPQIRSQLEKMHIGYDQLLQTVEAAGLPTKFKEIGWSEERAETAFAMARFMRDRFTFLDVAALMEA